MEKTVIAFLILLALALAGCVGEKQTYQYEKNHERNLTLYPDGTYVMYDGVPIYESTGNYKIEGNTVRIERAFGIVYSLRIVDNKLVDSDNDAWVRV